MESPEIPIPARRPDLFDPNCPTRQLLDRIGDRWTVLVVLTLLKGTLRFTELRRAIPGVTPKALTATLRGLERDGMVDRRVFAEVPPRVEYTLTPLGRSLEAPLRAIKQWAEGHITEIEESRSRIAGA
jgi:DNA-binding HxlR family transcriptional regulator